MSDVRLKFKYLFNCEFVQLCDGPKTEVMSVQLCKFKLSYGLSVCEFVKLGH